MAVLLTIGEFSRMSHLSVKALRHYHDVGLLEPADIDPATGYRFYAASQVPVASLRGLLEGGTEASAVEFRSIGPTRAMAIAGSVSFADSHQWLTDAFAELVAALDEGGITATGPGGGLYWTEFFEAGTGDVMVFVPVAGDPPSRGRVAPVDVPAAELAVVMHRG